MIGGHPLGPPRIILSSGTGLSAFSLSLTLSSGRVPAMYDSPGNDLTRVAFPQKAAGRAASPRSRCGAARSRSGYSPETRQALQQRGVHQGLARALSAAITNIIYATWHMLKPPQRRRSTSSSPITTTSAQPVAARASLPPNRTSLPAQSPWTFASASLERWARCPFSLVLHVD